MKCMIPLSYSDKKLQDTIKKWLFEWEQIAMLQLFPRCMAESDILNSDYNVTSVLLIICCNISNRRQTSQTVKKIILCGGE